MSCRGRLNRFASVSVVGRFCILERTVMYRIHMAINKQKKTELRARFVDSVSHAHSIVFVSFDKLNVFDTTELRKKFRGENVGYMVVKKTLLKKALEKQNFKGDLPELPGEVAIAYGTDLLVPAREAYEFQKAHKEQFSIVGGVFDGMYKNKEEMLSIATIPGLQQLRGMFVNLINSPIQRFAVVLDQIAQTKTS